MTTEMSAQSITAAASSLSSVASSYVYVTITWQTDEHHLHRRHHHVLSSMVLVSTSVSILVNAISTDKNLSPK